MAIAVLLARIGSDKHKRPTGDVGRFLGWIQTSSGDGGI